MQIYEVTFKFLHSVMALDAKGSMQTCTHVLMMCGGVLSKFACASPKKVRITRRLPLQRGEEKKKKRRRRKCMCLIEFAVCDPSSATSLATDSAETLVFCDRLPPSAAQAAQCEPKCSRRAA